MRHPLSCVGLCGSPHPHEGSILLFLARHCDLALLRTRAPHLSLAPTLRPCACGLVPSILQSRTPPVATNCDRALLLPSSQYAIVRSCYASDAHEHEHEQDRGRPASNAHFPLMYEPQSDEVLTLTCPPPAPAFASRTLCHAHVRSHDSRARSIVNKNMSSCIPCLQESPRRNAQLGHLATCVLLGHAAAAVC